MEPEARKTFLEAYVQWGRGWTTGESCRERDLSVIPILLLVAACFLAYSNGANDNAKGIATLYGSRTTNFTSAIRWATVMTLLGSVAAVFLANALLRNFQARAWCPMTWFRRRPSRQLLRWARPNGPSCDTGWDADLDNPQPCGCPVGKWRRRDGQRVQFFKPRVHFPVSSSRQSATGRRL